MGQAILVYIDLTIFKKQLRGQEFRTQNERTLKEAWSKSEENSNLLKIQPENFIVYSFAIEEHPKIRATAFS